MWKNVSRTDKSFETRRKEHFLHLYLYLLGKSPVAEHETESGNRIKFQNGEVLAEPSGHMDQLVEKARRIKLHSNNTERTVQT
jgi:hypothetical protein